jgi:hypothetical protein
MKKALSLVMAFAMAISLVPAAFAAGPAEEAPDTITLPNGEVREIPVVEPVEDAAEVQSFSGLAAATNDTDETDSNVQEISSVDEFTSISQSDWLSGKTFVITQDLDFSGVSVDEWYGIIPYFYATLKGVEQSDGHYTRISGIPNNCALIYGIVGGTIQDLEFVHNGDDASFISLFPARMGDTDYSYTLENVTVSGTINLTGSDQSNYSPFVYCGSTGGLTMKNCINKATITGPVYGSVFHGYYPFMDGTYVFDGCKNEGNVSLNYAGLFFGNSSNIDTRISNSNISLTIKDCENNGGLRGAIGAKFLAAPVTAVDGAFVGTNPTARLESVLDPTVSVVGNGAEGYDNVDIAPITGVKPLIGVDPGFTASLNGNNIVITNPADMSSIDRYVVSVGAYVYTWTGTEFSGTDRYSLSEEIDVSESDAGASITATLKAYGFADGNFGTVVPRTSVLGNTIRKDSNENRYYEINNEKAGVYVSSQVVDGTPAANGAEDADFITVSAYNGDSLVGFVTLHTSIISNPN